MIDFKHFIFMASGRAVAIPGEHQATVLPGPQSVLRVGHTFARRAGRTYIRPAYREEIVDGSSSERWDLRLQEVIDTHINNLRQDFQRLIGELPLQPPAPEEPGLEPVAETLARLRTSVDSIHASRGQREMAARLLDASLFQAARAALFLVRGEGCHGFDTRGFEGAQADVSHFRAVPDRSEPLGGALSRQTTAHIPGSSLGGSVLATWLAGQTPAQVCLAPVVVGGRTVAILYADSGPEAEGGRIHPEAIEILASVAGMYLERMRRDARPAEASAPEPEPASPPATERAAAVPAPAEATPQADEAGPAAPPPRADEPPLETASAAGPMAHPETVAERDPLAETVPLSDWNEADLSLADHAGEAAPQEATPSAPPPPAPDDQADEDARRFARLLVSEIVLYNEAQVKTGRKKRDLYSRLQEAVDRSREAFVDRFGSGTIAYFEDELVRTLAEGDAAAMGEGYTGA